MVKHLIWCWVFSGFLWAQPDVYEEYTVSVHQLHVNVTDRSGNPIKDLKAEDFDVRLNGKSQEIVSVIPISLQQQYTSEQMGIELPEHGKRLFLFMFDMRYTTPDGMERARRDVMKFAVEDMLPRDLVSVFTMTETTLRMVCNFTSDKNQILQAVKTFGFDVDESRTHKATGAVLTGNVKDKNGISAKQAFASLRKQIIEGNDLVSLAVPGKHDAPVFYTMHAMRNSQLEAKKGSMISYLDQFQQLANYLRVIKGRKNLVLFSSGFEGDIVVGIQRNAESEQFAAGNIISTTRRLVESLQGSGTTVFTVDTSNAGSVTEKTGLHVLNDISASSGGRLYTNTEKFGDVLKEIKTITNDYYLVNVKADLKIDRGELARVKVKVDRPKSRVYTSKGLLVKPDYSQLNDMERQLMLTDFMGKNITASFIPTRMAVNTLAHDDHVKRLNVLLELDGDYFLNTGNPNKPSSFDVTVAVFEKQSGILSDQYYRTFTIIPNKARPVLERTGMKYFANLFAGPGSWQIKAIVRNLNNGQTTSIIRELEIDEKRTAIQGPYAVSTEPWMIMRGEDLAESDADRLDYPFQFGGERFVPAVLNEMEPGAVISFLYVLDPGLLENSADIAAILMDAQGQHQTLPPVALKSRAYAGLAGKPEALILDINTNSLELQEGGIYQVLTRVQHGSKFSVFSYPVRVASN